jgi:hypothetical protein
VLPQSSSRFSRWYKLRENMADDPRLRLLLLDWICRRQQAPRLVDVTLVRWERRVRSPGEPPQPFRRIAEARWQCR